MSIFSSWLNVFVSVLIIIIVSLIVHCPKFIIFISFQISCRFFLGLFALTICSQRKHCSIQKLVKVRLMSHMIFEIGSFQNGLGQTMVLKLWRTDIIRTVTSILKFYMKGDHRSSICNVCSCEKEDWKKFSLVRGSNPWPLRCRSSVLVNWANKPTGSRSLNCFSQIWFLYRKQSNNVNMEAGTAFWKWLTISE